MTQSIILAGLPWTIDSEEPLPSKFDVFLERRFRSPEGGGHSPAQGEALGEANQKSGSPEGATHRTLTPTLSHSLRSREREPERQGSREPERQGSREPEREPEPVRVPERDPELLSTSPSPAGAGEGRGEGGGSPILRVLPDLSLVGEKAPWDPTITHEHGIIRYRGQEVAAEGRLPLDEFVVRAAPNSLGAERALLGWMVTRMTYRGEGIFLHAASIRGNGGAWLLVGGPGVGKSTACRLLGERSLCTNVTCLREENGRWMAYPTAFTGQPDPPPPERGPFPVLGAIVLRKNDTVGTIEPVAGTARMAWLAKAIVAHYPSIPECTNHVVGALASLATGCRVYTLAFRRDAISMPD